MSKKISTKIIEYIKNPREFFRKFFAYYILSVKFINIIYKMIVINKTFFFKLGFLQTMRKGLPIDKDGKVLPWYTYPAIEYLSQFDLREKEVFEYGIGNSSLYFAERARLVVSVDDDEAWFDKINGIKKKNNTLLLAKNKIDYLDSLKNCGKKFDIIIVDASHRYECASQAVEYLKPGGIIILDNSDWFPRTSQFLREKDLLEIDFSGFGPFNQITWTTSLYLRRDFAFKTLSPRQPLPPVGSFMTTLD